MANFEINNLSELVKNGAEILFVDANRETSNNGKQTPNVKGKINSLKTYGLLQPLTLIPAGYAAEEGLLLVDAEGKEVTDEQRISNSYIILDGNNRYKAYLAIQKEKAEAEAAGTEYKVGKALDEMPCLIQQEKPEEGVLKTLIEMNTTSISWKAKDYGRAAAKLQPNDEVIQFIKEQQDKKMSISTIGYYLTFVKSSITDKKLANVVKGEALDVEVDLPRAKRVLEVLAKAGFKQSKINNRYIIQFIASKADKLDVILDAFGKLTDEQVKAIEANIADSNAFNPVKVLAGLA